MSNLLKDASILLTPTGYDNGSMNAIKPENGDGDFQFERNSAATRVNAQGLVENVQIISSELVSNGNFSQIGTEEVLNGNFSQQGSELVTNGDFATDSDWIKAPSGVTISRGSANFNSASDTYVYQDILTANKTYKVTFSGTVNSGSFYIGEINVQDNIYTVGTYTNEVAYFTVSSSVRFIIRKTGAGALDATIDNVSVKEVGQNWSLSSANASIGENKLIANSVVTENIAAQNAVVPVSKPIILKYDVIVNSGNFRILLGSGGTTTEITTSGTYTFYETSGTGGTLTLQARGGGFDGSVTNISVKEVGQDWTLGTGWSIGDGVAIFNDITTNRIFQTGLSIISGKKYKIGFTIADCPTTAHMTIYDAGGSDLILPNENYVNGDYTRYYTATTNEAGVSFWGNTAGDTFTLTNISLKEVTDDTNIPRINYEGFSYQDVLGSELITNGDFSVDSNWSKGTGWAINGGKANVNATSFTDLYQNIGTVAGKTYKISFEVSNYVLGTVKVILGYGSSPELPLLVAASNGVYEVETTPNAINPQNIYISTKTANTQLSIDNVSVKEVLGQEVVPDSGCGSWLLEPQSTNLIITSDSGVYGNSPGSEILTTSPDGTNTAVRPVPDSASDRYTGQISAGAYSTNTKVTYSWYRKRISTPVADFYVGDLYPNVLVNLTKVGSTTQVESDINGFDRFSATFNINDGSLASNIRLYFGPVIGVGNSSVAYWGHQLEVGSFATSLIPTNGATNTRLQDIANNSGNSSLINSTEGTLYAEIASFISYDTIEPNRYITLTNGTSNQRIALLFGGNTNQLRAIAYSNTQSINLSFTTFLTDTKQYNKLAVKYKSGDYAFFLNGVKIGGSSETNIFPANTLNDLSFDVGGGTQKFRGKNKALAVYKEALTDANLRCLTYPNPVATTFDLDFDTIAEQFTFTRGSEATFVNEQGLIESTNQLGSELVTNGDFATNSDWTAVGSGGWTISGGSANSDGTSSASAIYQQNILVVGKTYKITFTATITSGTVAVSAGFSGAGAPRTASGTYTEILIASTNDELYIKGTSNFVGSIDNVSVKEVISATNTPRIDYSTGAKAFLLEPQSTNLIPYSEDFSNAYWIKSGVTLTSNNAISPDGSLNASLLKGDGVTSFPRVQSTVSGSGQISFSVFVKKELSDEVTIYISGTGIGGGGETSSVFKYTFSTDSLSIVSGGGVDSSESTSFPNDWVRLTLNYTTTTITGLRIYSQYASASTDGVYIWGAQLEQQSYATSYIPTSGASATRNQELCVDATPVINSEEGVLYAEISALANDGTYREFGLSDGTSSNRVLISYTSTTNQIRVNFNGSGGTSLYYTAYDIKDFNKIAAKWKENDFALWVNGVEVATDTSGASFSTNTLNSLNFNSGYGGDNFFGNTKDLKVYPKALADVQLEALTSFGSFTEMANALNYTII